MADNGQDQAGGVPHVVIVGGGVAGLSAAFFLRDKPVRVTVLEATSRLGGKLSMSQVADVAVDEGAESVYRWRPKTTGLLTAAGLGEQLTSASTMSSATWTRGAMRPLPGRQIMGIPADLDELARSGMLSDAGVARAREDLDLPPSDRDGDVSVASYVTGRLGQEVVDRLVDPFLAGVFAGRAEELSFEATLTPLAMASRKHASLAEAARSVMPPPLQPGEAPPPLGIATITGGLGSLPGVLAEAVLADSPGATVRTGATVSGLERTEHGWRLTVGSGADPEYITADAVIVAAPAGPAGRLLAGASAAPAAAALAEVPYASVATITFAYPRDAFPGGLAGLGLSGYRVPAVEERAVKEVIFSTVKWPHLKSELEIVRCSVGRTGEDDLLRRDDADLAALATSELAEVTGAAGAPVATRVVRWDDSLPQYTVGHVDRVARIRSSVAGQPGLAVCGAVYDGVGVGQCVASARKASDQVTAWLRKNAAARSNG